MDPRGGIVGETEKEPFPDPVDGLDAGCFEVDPAEVVRAVVEVVSRLLRRAPAADSLYLCGQMGGAILVDKGGEAATRYISWRDQRSMTLQKGTCPLESAGRIIDPATLAAIGNELKPGSTVVLLHALARIGALPVGLVPGTIGDAVASALCGKACRMHPTMAIGMLDLGGPRPDWHRGMIAALGLGGLEWLSPASLDEPVGEARLDGRVLRVFAAAGDQPCALLGAGLEPGELSLNVSTGAQVSQLESRFNPSDCQTRCYFGGWLLRTITHIPAGRSLHALADLFTEVSRAQGLAVGDPWGTLCRLMEGRGETDLEVDLAFFPSPVGDAGRIGNITLGNLSAGAVMAAATRNLADNLAACARRLNPAGGWSRSRLSGGLSQALRPLAGRLEQLLAPLEVLESGNQEETLGGLARIAAAEGEPNHAGS